MSTNLRRTATEQEPVSYPELLAYFQVGCKPPDRWRVGAEFEKFALDRATGKQVGLLMAGCRPEQGSSAGLFQYRAFAPATSQPKAWPEIAR